MRGGVRTLALLVLLPLSLDAASAKIEKRTLTYEGKERVYYLLVPPSAGASGPAPLLLTLHGSGRTGKILIEKWKGLAEEEGIVLAGPDSTDPQSWNIPKDGPGFLHGLVEELRSKLPIDGRRIYLFGHSAGAVYAIEMAPLKSEYFAAAAGHAGALPMQYHNLFDYAKRKVPIFLIVGTRDAFFPLPDVRATRDALAARNIPVELWEISGHTHDYYGRAREINRRVWDFLRRHALTDEPKYTPYDFR